MSYRAVHRISVFVSFHTLILIYSFNFSFNESDNFYCKSCRNTDQPRILLGCKAVNAMTPSQFAPHMGCGGRCGTRALVTMSKYGIMEREGATHI